MHPPDEDLILLRRYAQRRDEAAFATIVRRYIDMVHSAAVRRVGERTLAEDVTQAVFLVLAQKANSFREGTLLSAWLLKTVRYASVNALRIETRRRRRDTRAAITAGGACSANPMDVLIWSEIARELDDAVLRLPSSDRHAVLMRYFQNCPISQIAHELSLTEETARKRLSRAIEKLRQKLDRSGITLPAIGVDLGTLLSTHVIHSAPSDFVRSICTAASSHAAARGAATTIAKGAINMMNWTRLKVAAVIATAGALVGTGTVLTVNRGFAQDRSNSPTSAIKPSTAPTTPPISSQLAEIMTHLLMSEHAINTLYIRDFHTTVEMSGTGKDDWNPTPMEFAGSAWLDDSPRGATRIFLTKNVMFGDNPDQASLLRSVDLSWDGREGRQIYIMPGPRQRSDRQAVISPDRPALLSERFTGYECGSAYSLQYLIGDEDGVTPPRPHLMLTDTLGKWEQRGGIPKITQEKIDDFDTVRLTWAGSNPDGQAYSMSYWFAPSYGYALIKSEEISPLADRRPQGITVKQLKEIARGIWFPMNAQGVLDNAGGPGKSLRYTYEADDAIANSLGWDKAVFSAKIPNGYLVSDRTKQPWDTYVLTPDEGRTEIHVGSVMPRVQQDMPVAPDANGHTE